MPPSSQAPDFFYYQRQANAMGSGQGHHACDRGAEVAEVGIPCSLRVGGELQEVPAGLLVEADFAAERGGVAR